ncbi:MAG: hypothetical protein QGG40_10835 [Myxococcota bacterium]|nr:hypothetical protein [Myxococcota bacterium]
MEFATAFHASRALHHGLAALRAAPGALLLAVLLVTASEQGWTVRARQEGTAAGLGSVDPVHLVLLVGAGLLAGVGALLIRAWLQTGYLRVRACMLELPPEAPRSPILEHDRTRWAEAPTRTLFGGRDRVRAMTGWYLLAGSILLGALVTGAVPGGALWLAGQAMGAWVALVGAVLMFVYVGLGLSLGSHAVVLDELQPTEALSRSWTMVTGNRLTLLGFLVIIGLFTLSGIVLLGVGILVTRGVAAVAFTEAYLLSGRAPAASRAPATGGLHG